MRRDEFLKNHWRRYPAQTESALDCAEYLAKPDRTALVGGRLEGEPGHFRLSSAGASFAVELSDCVWDATCLRGEAPAFTEASLAAGDLVCVRFEASTARTLSLLFAQQDPAWGNPAARAFRCDFAPNEMKAWTDFIATVRGFFLSRKFVEARTPTLVPSPGTEPFLDPFRTRATFGSRSRDMYLPTSPEFHLKKLLAAGYTRIFEMKDCFRDNEGGGHHQPEFLMLEWYRAYADLNSIARDAEELIRAVVSAPGQQPLALRQVTIAELFSQALGFCLTPATTREELLELAKREGIACDANESWDDVYFRVFLTRVEPLLEREGPCLVRDYPPSQAALARINEAGWADRFEIYWNGLEIANAFHELNDPVANRQRFANDAKQRAALGKTEVPHDEELVNALFHGMPPSGGIALGLDRLYMAVNGITEIEKTRPFPYRV